MKQQTGYRLFVLTAVLIWTLLIPACEPKNTSPIPPAGTSATSNSEVFKQAARGLQQDCARMGNCTCIMDGVQTTCALVFACLDAGFCQLVKTDKSPK